MSGALMPTPSAQASIQCLATASQPAASQAQRREAVALADQVSHQECHSTAWVLRWAFRGCCSSWKKPHCLLHSVVRHAHTCLTALHFCYDGDCLSSSFCLLPAAQEQRAPCIRRCCCAAGAAEQSFGGAALWVHPAAAPGEALCIRLHLSKHIAILIASPMCSNP